MSTSERYHHGDLRRALIAAALRLIDREGPESLTLRRLASNVGVTHAAVYRHFKDKQALLNALAVEGMAGLRDAMRARLAGESDPVAAFQAFCGGYATYAIAHPAHFRVMFGTSGGEGPLGDAREEMLGMLIAGVEACQRAGAVAPGPPEPLAVAAWSLVHGLAMLTIDGALGHVSLPSSDPRAVADLALARLLARPAGR